MTDVKETDMFAAVRANLEKIGYVGDLIQEDYAFRDFLSASGKAKASVPRIELAAFAQWPPSYRNACFGVTTPTTDSAAAITPFRALGAPQVLALYPAKRRVRRWKISATGDPVMLNEFGFDAIASTFKQYEKEWAPQRVLDARTLVFADAAAQLDFFDAGLLPALEASLRVRLERDIQHIMKRCKDVYAQQYPGLSFDDALAPVFRLVFRLIAAKMLIDRGNQTEWAALSAPQVIMAVDAFYFRNETPEPVLQNVTVQNAVWQQVLSGLDLQNLSVETLAYLYENAFVTEELRRDQSIHATPPEVAEYMIRQLPIDKLSYANRRIFEPFTGHAPFLTAALRRLRELLPKDISPQERHDYFVSMLSGMENEPFAREIARYALILADYPNPDGWRIRDANIFTSPMFDRLLQDSNIVLCNPPYGDFTVAERAALGKDAAYRKEAEALRRVLAQHPTMLGFVLPRSFLNSTAFRSLRQQMAVLYKSISVTILPEKTFNKASQEVACITAHNIDLLTPPYSYATVSSTGYDTFQHTGKPTWKDNYSSLVSRDNDVIFRRTSLQSVWQATESYARFSSIAEIHRGLAYKTGFLQQCVSAEPQPDFAPGVQTIQNYLEPYLLRDYEYLSTAPKKIAIQRSGLRSASPKVLINRARSSRNYWSITGGVDQQNLIFSHMYYGMWANHNTPIELLAAVISGPIANAYMFSERTGRDNYIHIINRIPVPSFTEEQTELIVSLVQEYYLQRGQWLVTKHAKRLDAHYEAKCRKLLYQIDAAVLEAYALPIELERELLQVFDGVPRRPLPFDFPGYGDDYERAKVELQQEKALRVVLKHYHMLVDKKYLEGLTVEEVEEMERLGREVDAYNAPFYEPIVATLEASQH